MMYRYTACIILLVLNTNYIPGQKPGDNIRSIFIDQYGIRWYGTDSGLIRNYNDKWEGYSLSKSIPLSINDIKQQKDLNSEIWLGTSSGVYSIHYSKDGINSARRYAKPELPFISDSILSIAFDKDHAGYFTTSKGIGILFREVWRFYTRLVDIIRDEFTSAGVKGDTIYFGTKGEGVARIVKGIDGFTGASSYVTPWSHLAGDSITSILIDSKGNQWYGTTRGLSKHSGTEAKEGWNFEITNQIPCQHITAIAEDKQGNIWLGTMGGLVMISEDHKNIKCWTQNDGLISDIINCLCIDHDQSVWIGTDHGVSHFTEERFINFKTSDFAKGFVNF